MSVDELSYKSGVSKATIYRILNAEAGFVQRAIIRKIAEGTGREFKISGDQVTFFKKQQQANNEVLTDREQELLSIFRKASEAEKKTMLNFLEGLCDLLAKSRATATEKGG